MRYIPSTIQIRRRRNKGKHTERAVATLLNGRRILGHGFSVNDIETDDLELEVKARGRYPIRVNNPIKYTGDTVGVIQERYVIMVVSEFLKLKNDNEITIHNEQLIINSKPLIARLFSKLRSWLPSYATREAAMIVPLLHLAKKKKQGTKLTALYLHQTARDYLNDNIYFLMEDVRVNNALKKHVTLPTYMQWCDDKQTFADCKMPIIERR